MYSAAVCVPQVENRWLNVHLRQNILPAKVLWEDHVNKILQAKALWEDNVNKHLYSFYLFFKLTSSVKDNQNVLFWPTVSSQCNFTV